MVGYSTSKRFRICFHSAQFFYRTQKISRIITKARTGINAAKVMARDRMPQRNMALHFRLLFISRFQNAETLQHTTQQAQRYTNNSRLQKNTPASVMWCVLGLRAIKERHKLAQFKDYLRVCGDHQHPLHKIWTSYQNKTRARHRFDDTSSVYHRRMQTLCGGNQNGNRYSLQKSERQMYPGNFYTWA